MPFFCTVSSSKVSRNRLMASASRCSKTWRSMGFSTKESPGFRQVYLFLFGGKRWGKRYSCKRKFKLKRGHFCLVFFLRVKETNGKKGCKGEATLGRWQNDLSKLEPNIPMKTWCFGIHTWQSKLLTRLKGFGFPTLPARRQRRLVASLCWICWRYWTFLSLPALFTQLFSKAPMKVRLEGPGSCYFGNMLATSTWDIDRWIKLPSYSLSGL